MSKFPFSTRFRMSFANAAYLAIVLSRMDVFGSLRFSSLRLVIPALATLLLALAAPATLRAATIQAGNVTTTLGPTFFLDDASNGGGDADISQSGAAYIRFFTGLLTSNQGPTRVTLTGFGFAAHTSTTSNNATTIAVTVTYLGADQAVGGGDDVVIGTAAGTYNFTGGGEYVFAFDTPLVADLTITGTSFRIQIAPSNASGTGSLKLKTPATGNYQPKLSVAGVVAPVINPERFNLAKFQTVTASSSASQRLPTYFNDGVVGNDNRWQGSSSTWQWVRVDFPFPVEVGSAQVFTGVDDTFPIGSYGLQYWNGSTWVNIDGGSVTGNTNVERNLVFTNSVTASSFRFMSAETSLLVRELAIYPPNGPSGFPLGTDVTLNLAYQRPTVASSNSAGNFPLYAVDGRSNAFMWQTTTAGTNTLDIDLRVTSKIGSVHLYSGSTGVSPLANFVLKYWNGTAWQNITGGSVTGNTVSDLVVAFTPVTTSQVRLEFTNPGTTSIRELCIFPANTGNVGYPIGTNIIDSGQIANYEDYNDAYYRITNPSSSRFMAVASGGQPALDQAGLTTAQGQYQILLNVSNGTYRLRNRATGNCLSGAQLSKTPGDALTDAPYTALPHQDWILNPLGGGAFQIINVWSGLAIDTQGGGSSQGTLLVQNTASSATTQSWKFSYSTWYPKKGSAGTSYANTFNPSWAYNWGQKYTETLPAGCVYNPMQWGDYNWLIGSNAGPLWQYYPTWRDKSEAMHLLGFNEPDGATQANITVSNAITMWPRLQELDQPLVSPVTTNPNSTWMNDFMTQANSLGYRVDAIAAHNYPDPGGGSSDALVNLLQTFNTAWSRPVWLTEFSSVDWSAGTWAQTSGVTQALNGVYGSGTNSVWAVGAGGTILSSTNGGTTWSAQTSGVSQALNGVWGSSSTSVWAVGAGGTILKFNGTTWSAQTSGTTQALYGVWGSDASNVWAVGANGTILKFNGTSWSPQTSGTTQALYGVWGSSSTSVWAVGANGTILKFNGTSWSPQTSGTTQALYGVWGSSSTSVWAVGANGTILKFNGTSWNAQTSGVSGSLTAVWGSDASNLWVAGDTGRRLRTTDGGASWNVDSYGSTNLNGVWGSSVDNVWTVGDSGRILISKGTTSTWTEEDNYNWLAEFMWRAESLSWLRHYSLFLWSSDADNPEPANPWDTVAPRGNAFQNDGITPTPFGELYFAWDCDANVRGDKVYFIHNRGYRKRLRNTGSGGPAYRWIRDGGSTTQWVLRPSATAGQYYITSLLDGKRLRYSGGVLDYAPANTTGTTVSWSLVENQYGWFYVDNPAASAANRRLQLSSAGVFSMVSNTTTTDYVKWRFIVPYAPGETSAPAAVSGLSATAGDTQVSLAWTASASPDFSFYSVYRSTTSGGPYTLVSSGTTTGYTDTSLQNGTIYYYVVTATDQTGYESTQSSQSVVTPVIATPPLSINIAFGGGNVTVSWPATHLGWILESQTNGLLANGWSTVPNSTTTTSYSVPVAPGATRTFFRLKHP